MKKGVWSVIVLVVVIVLAAWVFGGDKQESGEMMQEQEETQQGSEQNANSTSSMMTSSSTGENQPPAATAKEFTVNGSNFKFDPSTITVKKGDTVKIVFKNIGGLHDFKIDEFEAATQRINTGAEESIQFVADTSGSFEYYCSVGSHRAMGMKGTLTVQ